MVERRENDVKLAVIETQLSGIERRLSRVELIIWGVAAACAAALFTAWNKGLGL